MPEDHILRFSGPSNPDLSGSILVRKCFYSESAVKIRFRVVFFNSFKLRIYVISMDIEQLQAEFGPAVEREIASVITGRIPNLQDAVEYHMGTGGKKMRPLLAILTYRAISRKDDISPILPFAAACELLHSWLLVHDDIEDGDRVRRDKPALWVKYGLAHGVNVGDYMAHKVFELVMKSRRAGVDDEKTFSLTRAIIETALHTAEGQTMDINLRASSAPSESDYLDMVIGKTAHYLTVPMVGAAIVAGHENLVPSLIDYGSKLGPAFQIADDLLDLTEGKGRGEIGRDIKEGKRSILIVHCLSRCSAEEKKKLLAVLDKTPEDTEEGDVLFVKSLLEKHGSLDYSRKLAENYTAEAKRIADGMPAALKEILYFFADYSVKRRK
jgi:geranylgeranyl pyrophosphate synthase